MPLKEQPDEFAVHEPDCKELIAFLKAMEFSTITKRVAAHFEVEDLDAIAPAPTVANAPPPQAGTAGSRSARRRPMTDAMRAPINHDAYVTVTTAKDLDAWIARALRHGHRLRRYRNHLARSHAGRPLRRVAGGGAGRGLLHPLRPSQGRRLPLDLSQARTAANHRADGAKPMCWRG